MGSPWTMEKKKNRSKIGEKSKQRKKSKRKHMTSKIDEGEYETIWGCSSRSGYKACSFKTT
jgi:hypothetical protein